MTSVGNNPSSLEHAANLETNNARANDPATPARAHADDTPVPAHAHADELTNDAFLGGRVSILQPRSTYRAGIDAVLLAAAISPALPKTEQTPPPFQVIDAGAGVGTVGLCVSHRLKHANVTMIEKNAQLHEIAARNIENNSMGSRASALCADITAPAADLAAVGITENSFDCVLANPPYHSRAAATPAKGTIKRDAHAMHDADLDRWFRFMTRVLAPKGTAVVIHKASSLDRILNAWTQRFGGIEVLPIHPRLPDPANRVIVKGIKGSRAELKIRPPLVLHNLDNSYTEPVENVLRHGTGLEMFA